MIEFLQHIDCARRGVLVSFKTLGGHQSPFYFLGAVNKRPVLTLMLVETQHTIVADDINATFRTDDNDDGSIAVTNTHLAIDKLLRVGPPGLDRIIVRAHNRRLNTNGHRPS